MYQVSNSSKKSARGFSKTIYVPQNYNWYSTMVFIFLNIFFVVHYILALSMTYIIVHIVNGCYLFRQNKEETQEETKASIGTRVQEVTE